MVENYVIARNTVIKKVKENDPFFPFMVCALYGLLSKYKGHHEMICDLFLKTDIIFEEGSVPEILKRHNIEQEYADPIHDEDGAFTTYGVSNQGHSFVMKEDGNVEFVQQNPFVICSLDNTNFTQLLNTFCHEMGHLIKGEINGYSSMVEDDDTLLYIIRTGLAHYVYCYRNDFQEMEFRSAFSILDDAINCIQTTDVLKEILALSDFVPDKRITDFIQSLDREFALSDFGYTVIVKLVRKLWENEEFQKQVEDNIVPGDIDCIVEHFNSLMGEDALENLSEDLEEINFLVEEGNLREAIPFMDSFHKIVAEYSSKLKAEHNGK